MLEMPNISSSSTAGGELRGFTKRDLIAEFSDYMVRELDRSPRTATSYAYSLKSLARFSDKPIEKCSSDDLRAYKRETDFSQSTKQGVVVATKAFHAWGALEGLWKLNGHGEDVTARYARIGFEKMQAAIGALDYWGGEPVQLTLF